MNFSSLTYDERERVAYASGNWDQADIERGPAELEDQIRLLEDEKEDIAKSEFQRGKDEGFGMDAAKYLRDMEHDLEKAHTETEKSREIVCSLLDLFHTDAMKTVAGRKQIHNQLQTKLIQLGY
jgi:hypothetical protein